MNLPPDVNPPSLDFWFAIGSTYTYLSVMRVDAAAARHGIAVRWRPFNLRSIIVEMNNIPFEEKPVKMAYMWRDLTRRAQRHGLDFRGTPPYPIRGKVPLNLLALIAAREGWVQPFAKACYSMWFHKHLVPSELENAERALQESGQDPSRVMAMLDSAELLESYAHQTNEARGLGVFGAPSFTVGRELFWGDDRLEEALEWAKRPIEQRLL